jgi:hypothetical protein
VDIGLFAGAVLNDTQEFKRLFPFKFVAGAMAQNQQDHRDWEAIRAWAKGVRAARPSNPSRPSTSGTRSTLAGSDCPPLTRCARPSPSRH